ncbi:MAG TPA: acyloxyacyl hydrolase [Chthoniobacterales bacterium]|nr:acyloxyacyl hydrolase [Chthoniobacterales bacterium]
MNQLTLWLRAMNFSRVAIFALAVFAALPGLAGAMTEPGEALDAPRFEIAAESAYLLGFINSPHSYEIGAELITAHARLGIVEGDSWLRGYNQFYFSAVAEPIFRGIENHYFGINFGLRYNFVRPNSRLIPYVSGGVGLGWIDSHASIPGAQGQDFTFNIMSAIGVSYQLNDRWKLNAGALYEHLSNGGQTDPNPSLNLIGPQIGLTYSF